MYTNAEAYQTSKTEISAKTAKDIQSLTVLQKTPSQKSGGVLNISAKTKDG